MWFVCSHFAEVAILGLKNGWGQCGAREKVRAPT